MNIDKQLIDAINEWLLNLTDGYFQLSKYSMGDDDTTWNAFDEIKKVTLEANKQSILKAIMEKAGKQYRCEFCNNTGKIWSDFVGNYVPCNTEHDCEEDKVVAIESVIKEILK